MTRFLDNIREENNAPAKTKISSTKKILSIILCLLIANICGGFLHVDCMNWLGLWGRDINPGNNIRQNIDINQFNDAIDRINLIQSSNEFVINIVSLSGKIKYMPENRIQCLEVLSNINLNRQYKINDIQHLCRIVYNTQNIFSAIAKQGKQQEVNTALQCALKIVNNALDSISKTIDGCDSINGSVLMEYFDYTIKPILLIAKIKEGDDINKIFNQIVTINNTMYDKFLYSQIDNIGSVTIIRILLILLLKGDNNKDKYTKSIFENCIFNTCNLASKLVENNHYEQLKELFRRSGNVCSMPSYPLKVSDVDSVAFVKEAFNKCKVIPSMTFEILRVNIVNSAASMMISCCKEDKMIYLEYYSTQEATDMIQKLVDILEYNNRLFQLDNYLVMNRHNNLYQIIQNNGSCFFGNPKVLYKNAITSLKIIYKLSQIYFDNVAYKNYVYLGDVNTYKTSINTLSHYYTLLKQCVYQKLRNNRIKIQKNNYKRLRLYDERLINYDDLKRHNNFNYYLQSELLYTLHLVREYYKKQQSMQLSMEHHKQYQKYFKQYLDDVEQGRQLQHNYLSLLQ